ncbi:MAG: hypothetical protein ACKV2Q_24900 [Planctomycetaceae bacterium]
MSRSKSPKRSGAKTVVNETAERPAARKRKTKGPLLVDTQANVVKALQERGFAITATRTIREWIANKDCPGANDDGLYDVDAIDAWAIANSDKVLDNVDDSRKEFRKLKLDRERDKNEQERLKTADMLRADLRARGDILPRSIAMDMIITVVAVARTQCVGLPKQLASLADDPKLKATLLAEGKKKVASILEALAKSLEQVPAQAIKAAEEE